MDPFLGQIQAFGFNFAPVGWAHCNGQLLAISQNSALFSLIGTTYGGDGRTTFALPDLRGRSIIHPGTGPGLSTINWGQRSGLENVNLLTQNMPSHNHILVNGQANIQTTVRTSSGSPTNESDDGANGFGSGGAFPEIYSDSITGTDKVGGIVNNISGSTTNSGNNVPFSIRNPFLGIYTGIALQGIFPSRN